MDRPTRELLARMPLADAVWWLWRSLTGESVLNDLFEQQRGRCYLKLISFPLIVRLIADALMQHGGSAHRTIETARHEGHLEASAVAVYGKLKRMPIALSTVFLASSTDRLRPLFPQAATRRPPRSLRRFSIVILDGKAIKRVAKRLGPLRGTAGGLLGGRALVALDFQTGLVGAMHAHPDGDANDVRFVPELLPEVRRRFPGAHLWMADRQFCGLVQMRDFTAAPDNHFLVRYHQRVGFHRDHKRLIRRGKDEHGRKFVEDWGWLGDERHPDRRYVRRIRLTRPGEEELILVTDLLEEQKFPANDLLSLYLERWGIERVFQQVTEVFGLEGLIGGTPEATVFQFALCLLLYNQMQLIRAFVAEAQELDCETISLENLYVDVRRQLTAWTVVVDSVMTEQYVHSLPPHQLTRRLRRLLKDVWSPLWIKAVNKQRRSKLPSAAKRTHSSVHRILEKAREGPS